MIIEDPVTCKCCKKIIPREISHLVRDGVLACSFGCADKVKKELEEKQTTGFMAFVRGLFARKKEVIKI